MAQLLSYPIPFIVKEIWELQICSRLLEHSVYLGSVFLKFRNIRTCVFGMLLYVSLRKAKLRCSNQSNFADNVLVLKKANVLKLWY